jgi:hypothetical protein
MFINVSKPQAFPRPKSNAAFSWMGKYIGLKACFESTT